MEMVLNKFYLLKSGHNLITYESDTQADTIAIATYLNVFSIKYIVCIYTYTVTYVMIYDSLYCQ